MTIPKINCEPRAEGTKSGCKTKIRFFSKKSKKDLEFKILFIPLQSQNENMVGSYNG